MQGDEGAIGAVGMGTPRVPHQEYTGGHCEELQYHRERFARGQMSGYQCEVLLSFFPPCVFWTDSCLMKVYDDVLHVGYVHLPSVC